MLNMNQESIPVECVPPAFLVPVGLPNLPGCRPLRQTTLDADLAVGTSPWVQIPPDADPS